MPQVLKEEVRRRILAAAEIVFAEVGYNRATMAGIAREAGVSTGNLYRYYESKEALFYTVITDEFAQTFLQRVRKRVAALTSGQLQDLDESARRQAEELLQFWIDNRRKVVVVLARADGSRYQGFADQFVAELVRLTIRKLKDRDPQLRITGLIRFTLNNIFENSVRAIVSILATYRDEDQIRRAFAAFWSYQLAGLAGFTTWVTS